MIYCCEKDWSDDAQAKLELAEKMLEIINGIIINGVVYGTWEQYKLIKDCTAAYDARH